MKKIIVGGLKNNVILENKECVVDLLCVCPHVFLPLNCLYVQSFQELHVHYEYEID